jgi:hypothetical protein
MPPLWRICSLDRSFRWCFILGGCVAVTHITFHVGTCDQTRSTDKDIAIALWSDSLTADSATSLPDRNFHTGGDYAAAAVSYAREFESSRDTPHDTKEHITPGSFTNYLLTSSLSFQSTQQYNMPNGVSSNQPPRGDHFMEVEVNPTI